MLAGSVRKYFWDIDTNKAKPKSHANYYIARILEIGDEKAFEWLKRVYGTKKIKKSLSSVRLSKRSAQYWKLYFTSHE